MANENGSNARAAVGHAACSRACRPSLSAAQLIYLSQAAPSPHAGRRSEDPLPKIKERHDRLTEKAFGGLSLKVDRAEGPNARKPELSVIE